MRVLFDAFWWERGPVSNRHLMISMITEWAELYPQDEIVVALREKDRDRAEGLPARARVVTSRLSPQGVSAMLELPILARKVKADVIFAHNFTPLWHPSVVFLHDVLFITNPEWFTRKERLYFALMPLSARRARAIVTSSRSEAARIDGAIAARTPTTAVGLGLGDRLEVAESRPAVLADVDRFLLTVGRLNVRKNLAFTCQAAVRSGAVSPEFPLVIAGSVHGRTEDWPEEVRDAIDSGSIVVTGYVSDPELAWLYSHCRAFLFLSRGEGFGLPPLEAMRAGAEVIASDIPVMREILGPYASFVDTADSRELETQIRRVAAASRTDHLSTEAREWASSFSWERTIDGIRSVAASAAAPERTLT